MVYSNCKKGCILLYIKKENKKFKQFVIFEKQSPGKVAEAEEKHIRAATEHKKKIFIIFISYSNWPSVKKWYQLTWIYLTLNIFNIIDPLLNFVKCWGYFFIH